MTFATSGNVISHTRLITRIRSGPNEIVVRASGGVGGYSG